MSDYCVSDVASFFFNNRRWQTNFYVFLQRRFLVMQVLWLGNWDKMKLENKDTKEV
jgi:hypothetical protein